MDATEPAAHTHRTAKAVAAAARSNRKTGAHPWPPLLAAQGSSVAKWAKGKGVPPRTAQAWCAQGKANRAIPQHWADVIKVETKGLVPAASPFPWLRIGA